MKKYFLETFRAWPLLLFACGAAAVAQENKPPLLPGLIARANDGQREVTFITPTANFNLTGSQSIHPQLKPNFKTEWSGVLNVVRGGKYIFSGVPQGGMFLDDKEVSSQPLQLDGGEHPIRIVFERKAGEPARQQLRWQSDFFKLEPVPASVFGHRTTPTEIGRQQKLIRGRQLVEDLNCVGCHRSQSYFIRGRVAPDLTGIGSRISAKWIHKWLENPRHYRTNAAMPTLLKTLQLRADMTAFLSGLQTENPPDISSFTDTNAVIGEAIYQQIGCVACHGDAAGSLAGLGSKMNPSQLAQYLRDPRTFDQFGPMPHCFLVGNEPAQLATWLAASRNPEFEADVPPGDAQRGQQFYAIIGCANCHLLKLDDKKVSPLYTATAFEKLRPAQGCLAETPPNMSPDYHLTRDEREALNEFVKSPDASEAPVQDFARLTRRFQCNACHELFGAPKNQFAQMPPPLTDAGNKLRASWLDAVLNKDKAVRPWMSLRMPHFGITNMTPLVSLFAAQAGAEFGEGEAPATASPEKIQQGLKLIGATEGGLACIKCHDFRGQKSAGEMRGPDLIEMHARIRSDWLRRWLRDPSRVIPGTAMPNFFSELPEAKAEAMIDQILAAISTGANMPTPVGLSEGAQAYLVAVTNQPVLLRTFMPDTSPRSIAVGLPGGQNFCFDTGKCRLRYAWKGEFLDMRTVWAERGGKPALLLGKKTFTAPDAFPLRIGNPDREPIVKFRGYRIVNNFPEFMFDVDGVPVRERITSAGGAGLVCAFEIGATKSDVWFVAGDHDGASVSCSAGKLVDGRIKISNGGPAKFEITILATQKPEGLSPYE